MKRKSYPMKNLGQNMNRKKKQRRTMIDGNQSSATDMHLSTSTTNTNEFNSPLVSTITTSSLSSSQSMPFVDVPSFIMMKMKKRCAALSLGLTHDPSVLLSNYSTMSNETFKDVLSYFIQTTASKQVKDQSSSLLESLDHDEVVTDLRQWTHLKNMASYFQLQVQQWSHYLHMGITENIWTGRMVLKKAIKNSIRPSYGRRKHLIEQRLKIYQKKLQKMNEDLLTHLEQRPALLTDCDEMIKFIDDLVNRDQSELRIDLKRRQTLLKLDAQDHQLLQAFYSLKPKQAQIQTARKVWKAVHDEQMLRYEIEMFQIWLSQRSSSSSIFALTSLHLTTINHLLIRTLFDHPLDLASFMKTSDDNAHEQMVRYVADKAIIAAQASLDTYQCKAIREEMKLLNRKPKNQDVMLHEQIMNAMENRQQQLIHRMEYDMKQKQCLFR